MARTDDDLLKLLGDLENDQVERKEALSSDDVKDRVRQAICAFARCSCSSRRMAHSVAISRLLPPPVKISRSWRRR